MRHGQSCSTLRSQVDTAATLGSARPGVPTFVTKSYGPFMSDRDILRRARLVTLEPVAVPTTTGPSACPSLGYGVRCALRQLFAASRTISNAT